VIDPAVLVERDGVVARLPIVPLTEVLIETDGEIHWSRHFTHAGGGNPRHPPLEHQRNLYAALLAQACNFGSTRMAELTGISADTIDWTTQWYRRCGSRTPTSSTRTTATPWRNSSATAPCLPPTACACPRAGSP